MGVLPRFVWTLIAVLVVVAGRPSLMAHADAPHAAAGLAVASAPDAVTMRLGISPGEAHQQLPLGTDRRALERALPELFSTATDLGVRIETVSVGQGFWSEDETLASERDLDLVVSGVRENVLALAASLGQRWEQSAVYAWEPRPDGEMLTATIPLPGGTDRLSREVFERLVVVLPGGWHIRYAGRDSILFVANTGDESDEDFLVRMLRARESLDVFQVATDRAITEHVMMVALTSENYQRFIDGAIRGKSVALSITHGLAPAA